MLDFLVASFFGWPAILIAAILAVIGLFRRIYRFLVAAAIVALPPSWFLSGFPLIRSLVFLLPLLLFASGYSSYRGRERLAWLLAAPYFLSVWFLFIIVMKQ